MSKYRIKEYTPELMSELAYISKNLRYYTKQWQEKFGSGNRNIMKHWETKMDKFLSDNLITETNEID